MPVPFIRRLRLPDGCAAAAAAAAYFVLVMLFHPFPRVFEFDPDEGNEVIKALMIARDHPLYSQTWSDQPPLFSHMLRGWFALAGWTAYQGRILVLVCSSVLIWALYQTVRVTRGHAAALASVVMLSASWYYVSLSVSIMQALPTLMFAVLSIWALAKYRRRPHAAWMAASGAFLALSLLVKLATLPVTVPIGLAVLYTAWTRPDATDRKVRRLMPVIVWSAGIVLAGAILFVITIPVSDVMQLIRPHLAAQEQMNAPGYDRVFGRMMGADYAFALLGLVGVVAVLRKRDWLGLVPVVWCGLAYVSLWTHRPLWYHHYPLLAVPLCWTAGIAAGELFSRDLWRACRPSAGLKSSVAMLTLLVTAGLGVTAAAQIPGKIEREGNYAEQYARMTSGDDYTVAVLKQFRGRTEYVVTDRQMLAFCAGMMVPPELSVTSVKRVQSGELSIQRLVELLNKYEPGVVFLSWRKRIPLTRELDAYLKARYRVLYAGPLGDRCYVLAKLAENPLAILQEALKRTPQSWEGHCTLGGELARAGRDEEAVQCFARANAIQPSAFAFGGLGEALKRLGRNGEAAAAYENMGRILQSMGREENAAAALAEAGRLRQQNRP